MSGDEEKASFLAQMETTLVERLKANPGVYAARPDEILALYPVEKVADLYSDEVGHIPYTSEFFTALGTFVARKIDLIRRKPVKVVALDCDNTLWQGVVGEDGVEGLLISPAHQKLHQMMAAQLAAGRLVCLLSKNQEADVREVFMQRPEMGLKWDQITAVRVNWHAKAENIQALAHELQLGLDSFIFLDDNPVECAAMKAHFPEVLTLQVPTDPTALCQFLDHVWAFDTLPLTAEDEKRAAFYRQNIKRQQVRRQAVTFTDFLAQLEMKITIAPVVPEQLARVAQLTQRTNQFNATTVRRQIGDLQHLLNSGYTCLTAAVSDRFGNYGLVGVVIFQQQADALAVDTLLLSCRAMGRGVEHEMLRHVAVEAEKAGASQITVPYLPTTRNQPALDFLESIPAGTKQGQGEGWLFAYPVTAVTHLSYQPQQLETESESQPAPGAAADEEPSSAAPAPSGRSQQTATELATVDHILRVIEQQNRRQRPKGAPAYTAPQSELEQAVAELWCSLLGLEQVGIHDNFFELGGHSLLATRLVARLHETMQVDIPLRGFFETPTVSTLAQQIETLRWLNQKAAADTAVSGEREEFEI